MGSTVYVNSAHKAYKQDAESDTVAFAAVADTSMLPVDYCTLLGDEDVMDFGLGTDPGNKYMYSDTELKVGMNGFKAFIKYNPDIQLEEPLANPVVNIKLKHLAMMYDSIKNRTGYSADTCFAAIKVYYGLLNKKIIFICEPIALKHPKSSDKVYDYCDTQGTGIFYVADENGSFDTIGKALVDTLTMRYMDSVSITHFKRTWYGWKVRTADRKFRGGTDDWDYNDTRFCIMPLQQIMRMYRENIPQCETADPEDYIHFAIIANNYYVKRRLFGKILNYKVHLVVYTDNIKNTGFDGTFNGLGADFGQMCPPNCGVVQVPAYKIRQ